MRANEFIFEDDEDDFDQYGVNDIENPDEKKEYQGIQGNNKAEQIAELIQTNCSQMLKAYQQTGIVLWRGISGYPMNDTIITNIRPDRKTVDMPEAAHKKLDLAFRELGLTATRKNSIFCTTSQEIAVNWGRAYIIFVKDGWTGTVFNKYKTGYTFYNMRTIGTIGPSGESIKQKAIRIKEMGPIKVTPANLPMVLNDRYEDILITGESYIGFRYFVQKLTPRTNNIFKILGINPRNI